MLHSFYLAENTPLHGYHIVFIHLSLDGHFFFSPLFGIWNSAAASSVGKESACSAGDLGSIPGSGKSPGEGNGNPLQYSCLENPMDRGSWQATVYEVARVGHDLATKLLLL